MHFDGPLIHRPSISSLVTLVLFVVISISAVGVITSKHLARNIQAKIQKQNIEKENLQKEWSQMLLEQATWTANSRVEKVAVEENNMKLPEKVKMIGP